MTKKKNILIVAIIAVLVVAISGVSFAAWEAFIKPVDQTWIVNSNTPGTLAVEMATSTPVPYNGEANYETSKLLTVTSTIDMTLTASVVVKADLAGGTNFATLPDGLVASVTLSTYALTANSSAQVTATVKFPDCSNPKFYGAKFQVILTLDKAA